MGDKQSDNNMTFEAALLRLENIVQGMESGKIDLDSMLRSFEEGQRLIQFCNGKLNEVERKIEKLAKSKSGAGIEPQPMDVENDLQ